MKVKFLDVVNAEKLGEGIYISKTPVVTFYYQCEETREIIDYVKCFETTNIKMDQEDSIFILYKKSLSKGYSSIQLLKLSKGYSSIQLLKEFEVEDGEELSAFDPVLEEKNEVVQTKKDDK